MNMKRPIFAAALSVCLSTTAYAGWTDDWFNNAIVTGSGSYQNQQRGFYSAGAFQGRLNTAVDYPVTVSLPKLKSGCGGVDLFLGGMSFLDSDYLVQKFQNIIQAAPALAFDIALKTMTKELADSMSKLEGATNFLNNLQLDDCAISNRVVTAVAQDDPDVLGAVWNEITSGESLAGSIEKSYDAAQQSIQANNNSPTVDLKTMIADCPDDFRTIFESGSVIENAATLFGIDANAPIIRGYIGDVLIRAEAGDFLPVITRIEGCPANNRIGLDDMFTGTAEAKLTDGTCVHDNATSIQEIVRNNLLGIAAALENKVALDVDQVTFIDNSPVPVFVILRKAIAQGNVDATVNVMTDVVAAAYTYRVFDDLYRNTDYLFRKIHNISTMPGTSAAATTNRCDVKVFQKGITEFGRLHDSIREVRSRVAQSYHVRVQENLAHWQFAKLHEEEDRATKHRTALDVTQ